MNVTFALPTTAYEELVERLTADVLDRVSDRLGLTEDPLLSTRQAGAYLGYAADDRKGPQRIRDLARRRVVDADYDGTRLLVRKSELDRYLAQQKEDRQ